VGLLDEALINDIKRYALLDATKEERLSAVSLQESATKKK
jgi:hypothetical protein